MQKFSKCTICGKRKIVADYGYDHAMICTDCAIADDKLSEHVEAEMIKRYGLVQIEEWMEEAIEEAMKGTTVH